MKKFDFINNSFHFSIDDVFEFLIEISDKKIPIKKHYFFKSLYNIWRKYKIKTGLHLFYEGKIKNKLRTLKEVRIIKNEIKEGWIYFGPHALNVNTPPYSQTPLDQKKFINDTYKEIYRFAGKKFLCKRIRLHYYSESYEISKFLRNKKIHTLFSTDRKVGAHKIPKKFSTQLIKSGLLVYNKLQFIRTDYRIEFLINNSKKEIINNFCKTLKRKKFIIIYSHEYEFKKKVIINNLNKIMNILAYKLKLISMHP
jgi:hypothetical protein